MSEHTHRAAELARAAGGSPRPWACRRHPRFPGCWEVYSVPTGFTVVLVVEAAADPASAEKDARLIAAAPETAAAAYAAWRAVVAAAEDLRRAGFPDAADRCVRAADRLGDGLLNAAAREGGDS